MQFQKLEKMYRSKRTGIVLFCLMLVYGNLYAQQDSVYTLKQCIEAAIGNNLYKHLVICWCGHRFVLHLEGMVTKKIIASHKTRSNQSVFLAKRL